MTLVLEKDMELVLVLDRPGPWQSELLTNDVYRRGRPSWVSLRQHEMHNRN